MKGTIGTNVKMKIISIILILAFSVACRAYVLKEPVQVPKLVSTVSQSIVRIVVLIKQGEKTVPVVKGSGFIVGPDGLIATAAHVIEGIPQQALLVIPADVETFNPSETKASIITIDKEHDIALLQSSASRSKRALEIEPSINTVVGEDALLFGFPLGDPVLTVTRGMIAAKTTKVLDGATSTTKLIKLDSSVNKGNSGGPLICISTGRVIGLASLKEGSIQNRLKKLLKEKQRGSMKIAGQNPIDLIKAVIQDMELNLQLGLGYAVASEHLISDIEKNN